MDKGEKLFMNIKQAYELCKKAHPDKIIDGGYEYPKAYLFDVMDEHKYKYLAKEPDYFPLDVTLVVKETGEVIDTNIGNELIEIPNHLHSYTKEELEAL